jgi:hypothetical protein
MIQSSAWRSAKDLSIMRRKASLATMTETDTAWSVHDWMRSESILEAGSWKLERA